MSKSVQRKLVSETSQTWTVIFNEVPGLLSLVGIQKCCYLLTTLTIKGVHCFSHLKDNFDQIMKYLPQHFKEPLAMIAIRSPNTSASSIECVVSNIILPFLIFLINCHVNRIEYGSIPLVGSSRITTCTRENKGQTKKLALYAPNRMR